MQDNIWKAICLCCFKYDFAGGLTIRRLGQSNEHSTYHFGTTVLLAEKLIKPEGTLPRTDSQSLPGNVAFIAQRCKFSGNSSIDSHR